MRSHELRVAILCLAFLTPGLSQAFIRNIELSGQIGTEIGFFVENGATIGDKKTVFESNEHGAGDVWKTQFQQRMFLNGDIGEWASFHAEGNFVINPQAVDGFQEHRLYSQYDYFREFYIDAAFGDEEQFTTRIGKQQVVWGTADGIKLLDIVNPTDFRFLNQAPFEESRIPVWMAVGEYNPTSDINVQLIAAQSRPNVIPGLDADGDVGQPFILKGVDTITGPVDGFLNIAPALGETAEAFQDFVPPFTMGMAGTLAAVQGNTFTVQNFIDGFSPFCGPGAPPGAPVPTDPAGCPGFLDFVAQSPDVVPLGPFNVQLGGNEDRTNLVSDTFDASTPRFTFEYMNQTSFATFDTFARAKSEFRKDLSEDDPNIGFRFKQTTAGGINYSLNYYYHRDANPAVEIFWEDQNGNRLTPDTEATTGVTGETVHTVVLKNPNGSQFTPQDALDNNQGNIPTLVFREFQNRVHSVGAAFDASLDFLKFGFMDAPAVVRGEFLYQEDVLVPFIDRSQLAIGNVVQALRPDEVDVFKYVLGLDITVLTNLLVSGQLIQFVNLDFEDKRSNSVNGQPCPPEVANCGRYHGDPSTLALSNNLKKGDEVETFGSLFLSKPFGAEQQHRWNNIFIAENHGGFWNRFDLEYSFTGISENLIGTLAVNYYFGDEDTLFGQLENSSNVLVGLKYLFDPY